MLVTTADTLARIRAGTQAAMLRPEVLAKVRANHPSGPHTPESKVMTCVVVPLTNHWKLLAAGKSSRDWRAGMLSCEGGFVDARLVVMQAKISAAVSASYQRRHALKLAQQALLVEVHILLTSRTMSECHSPATVQGVASSRSPSFAACIQMHSGPPDTFTVAAPDGPA